MPGFANPLGRGKKQRPPGRNPFDDDSHNDDSNSAGGDGGTMDDIDRITDPNFLDDANSAAHNTNTNADTVGDYSDLTLDAPLGGLGPARRARSSANIRPLAPSARDRRHNTSSSLSGSMGGLRNSVGGGGRHAQSARQLYDELSGALDHTTGPNNSSNRSSSQSQPHRPQLSQRRSTGREVGLDQKLKLGANMDPNIASDRRSQMSSKSGTGSGASFRLGSIRASIRAETLGTASVGVGAAGSAAGMGSAVDVDRMTEEMEQAHQAAHAAGGGIGGASGGDEYYGGGFDERIEVGNVDNMDMDNMGADGDYDGHDNRGGTKNNQQQRRKKSFGGSLRQQHSSSSRVTDRFANGHGHNGSSGYDNSNSNGNGRNNSRLRRQRDASNNMGTANTATTTTADRMANRREAVRKSKLQKIQELQAEVRDLKKSNRELRRDHTTLERKHQNDVEENRLHVGVLEGRLRSAGLKDDVSDFTGMGSVNVEINRARSADSVEWGGSTYSDLGSARGGDAAARTDATKALSETAYKNKVALSVTKQKLGRVEDSLDATTRRCETLEDDKADAEYQLQQARVEMDRLKDQLAKAQEEGSTGGAAEATVASPARGKADEKTVKDLRSRNSLLKQEWEKSEERALDLAKKLHAKQKELETTRQEMMERISQAANDDANEVKRALHHHEDESDAASQSGPMAAIAALQEELQILRDAREVDRERFEERLKEAREEAATDAAHEISKNAMRESERRDELRRETDDALAEVDALRHDLELTRQDVEVEREVAKESVDRCNASAAEVDKLRDALAKSKDELLEVRNEFSNIERKHRSDMDEAEMIFRESAREMADAEAETTRLEQDLERTREELARAEADVVKIQTAEQESPDTAGRVQNEIVKNELARAKEEIERLLQEKKRGKADADTSLRELKTESDRELIKVKEELTVALDDLSKARDELELAKTKLSELEQKAEEETADADDVARLTAQLAEARDEVSAKERETERLKENIESAKEEVDNMWDRCDRLEEDNRALEDEIEELTKHHDEELDELKDQVSNTRKELERKTKNAEVMGKQMSDLQSELDSAKSRVEMLERQLANLRTNSTPAPPVGLRPSCEGDDAMSVSVRSGLDDTVGAHSQADMLASAAAAAQAKGGRGRRRIGSRLFRGSVAAPQVDADGNLTSEGQVAEKNMRIAELESQLDENVDAIRKLESDMVVLRTSFKDEEYKAKKKIDKLQEENTQYAIKVALLEGKLHKGEKGSTDTKGESEGTPSVDEGETKEGDSTVQVDAAYLGHLRNNVDRGKAEIEVLQSDVEQQNRAYGEMENRLRSEVETLQKDKDELETTLKNQQELLTHQRESEVSDIRNKLEARDMALTQLKQTVADLNEKNMIIKAKDESIAALNKQISEQNQQLQVMTEDMSMSSGNANGEVSEEQERLAATSADAAMASAAAFDLM